MITGQRDAAFSFASEDLFPRLMAFLAREDIPRRERLATALRVFEPLANEHPRLRATGDYADTLRRHLDVDLDPGEQAVAVVVAALRLALRRLEPAPQQAPEADPEGCTKAAE